MADFEFAGDFPRAQTVSQTLQDGFFARREPDREDVQEFMGADLGKKRCIGAPRFHQRSLSVFALEPGDLMPAALDRINALAGINIMLEMEPAALQVPTPGLTRVASFAQPQMDQRFLHQ